MRKQNQPWSRHVVEFGNKVLDFMFAKSIIYVTIALDLVIMTALLLDVIVIVQTEKLSLFEYIKKDFKLPWMFIGNFWMVGAHLLFIKGETPGRSSVTRKEHPLQFAFSMILIHTFALIMLSMTSFYSWKNRGVRVAESRVLEGVARGSCDTVNVIQLK